MIIKGMHNWTTKHLMFIYENKDYYDPRDFNIAARELHRRFRHRPNFIYKHYENISNI